MEHNILTAFINNAALLVSLSLIYEIALYIPSKYRRLQPILSGIFIALVCSIIMLVPFTLDSGGVFDTRTILISVTALIFGPIPTLITVVLAAVTRMVIGGVGTIPGLATIACSALIGLAWRRSLYAKSTKWHWLSIYVMSLIVHFVMLLCMLLFPYPYNFTVIRAIALPVFLIYPIVSVMLFLLLMRQQSIRLTQDQLRQSEERFKTLFDKAPLGYHSLDEEGHVIEINQQWCDLLGYARDEVIGKWFGDFLSPENKEIFRMRFPLFKAQGQIHSEFEVLHKNGEPIFIAFEGKISYGVNGRFKQTHCILQNISTQRAAETALAQSEEKYRSITENISDVVWQTDMDLNITYISPSVEKLLGEPPELFAQKSLAERFPEETLRKIHAFISMEMEKEKDSGPDKDRSYTVEVERYKADKTLIWVEMNISTVRNIQGDAVGFIGVSRDISQRKAVENDLKYIHEHDKWTGLHNRDYLELLLQKDIKKMDGLKRAIISINLSTVQLSTANYGFHHTQKLIKKAAETLGQYCTDTCELFRTHDSRFAFYSIGYKDTDELVGFCKTLRACMRSLFAADRIGGGIGVLEIEQDDPELDVDILLRWPLIASERARAVFNNDFGICFYDDELELAVNREANIRQALDALVADDSGNELFLQYQPILDLKTDSICGFEALARLKTAELGMVSPIEFIPIAEKTKQIIPIGEKIIIQALNFQNFLKKKGYETMKIFINISVVQLLGPGFATGMLELIRRMHINPKNVGIEITESVFVYDHDFINQIIGDLRGAGLSVSIDDFGTGYSSLSREDELNVDYLKIDKHFIDRLLVSDPEKVIAGDIISMAHKLGHSAIAEGVEYESQLKYLVEHNCDKAQGYLISKPLDEESALDYLIKRKNTVAIQIPLDNECGK